VVADSEPLTISEEGNGPIAAFVAAIRDALGVELDVVDYHEHSLGRGADATAVSYVEAIAGDTTKRWGIGTDPNIITASLRAVLSATSRLLDGETST
jgi:2-isopropylmalate synthase